MVGIPGAAWHLELVGAGGGTRTSGGPYWERSGVTIADPDGYRYVLCTRSWHAAA